MNNLVVKAIDEQKVFIVGDLHGEHEFFFKCLQKLGFNTERDILVCTGDLVDRGPKSYELLTHFLYNKNNFYSVRGNHDQFLVEHDYQTALFNGGGYSEVILNHIADIEFANACFHHADETGDDHLRDATEMMVE